MHESSRFSRDQTSLPGFRPYLLMAPAFASLKSSPSGVAPDGRRTPGTWTLPESVTAPAHLSATRAAFLNASGRSPKILAIAPDDLRYKRSVGR